MADKPKPIAEAPALRPLTRRDLLTELNLLGYPVTVQQLRTYETADIIRSSRAGPGKWGRYGIADIEVVQAVHDLRLLGLTIQEICTFLRSNPATMLQGIGAPGYRAVTRACGMAVTSLRLLRKARLLLKRCPAPSPHSAYLRSLVADAWGKARKIILHMERGDPS